MKSYLTALFADRQGREVHSRPLHLFAGMCVLMLAIMGTSVSHVAGTLFILLVMPIYLFLKRYRLDAIRRFYAGAFFLDLSFSH